MPEFKAFQLMPSPGFDLVPLPCPDPNCHVPVDLWIKDKRAEYYQRY